jgi:hypothetical protein
MLIDWWTSFIHRTFSLTLYLFLHRWDYWAFCVERRERNKKQKNYVEFMKLIFDGKVSISFHVSFEELFTLTFNNKNKNKSTVANSKIHENNNILFCFYSTTTGLSCIHEMMKNLWSEKISNNRIFLSSIIIIPWN